MTIARDFIDYPYLSNLGAAQVAGVLLADERIKLSYLDAFAFEGSTLRFFGSLEETHPDSKLSNNERAFVGAELDAVFSQLENQTFDAIVVHHTPFHRPGFRDPLFANLLTRLRQFAPYLLLADCYQSGQHYVEAQVLRNYPEADAHLKYEAEASIVDMLFEQTKGTIAGQSPKLNTLPLPAWDHINTNHLFRFHSRFFAQLGRRPSAFPVHPGTLPMVTSRGCPFRCVHCTSNPDVSRAALRRGDALKTQRRFSGDQLRERFLQLRALGATNVHFLDELINVNQSHFETVLDEIERLDMRFEVPNGFRADYLSRAHFARMRGRVTTVSVSAETGNQRVAEEVVDKQLNLEEIERVAEEAKRAAVPLLVHYMIGLPGETDAEIEDTLDFAASLFERFHAEPAVQFATPLPGSELAHLVSLSRKIEPPENGDWGPRFQKAPSESDSRRTKLETFMRIFYRRLDASRGPQKLIMNVTYVCNNHCSFCAVGTRTQVDGHPTRQREILDKYRRHGVRLVDFDGGEPTLNPELVSLIRYAKRIGFERINVTSNGRLLAYESFAKKLVQSGLSTLLFSVHGPDMATHAREVGVAEAFQQTTDGIRFAVKHKPGHVELGMNITLTKTNYKRQMDMAELALSLGLSWMNIQFLTPFGRATTEVAPDTAEAARLTSELINTYGDRMKFQVINLPWCYMPRHETHLVGDSLKAGRHMIFVNNDTVNLADYLAERREKKSECRGCAYGVFCSGFYKLEDAPEPEWLVTPESLTKKISPELDVR